MKSHASPGPPVSPVQGRRAVACAREAVGAPPGAASLPGLDRRAQQRMGRRVRYPQTRRWWGQWPPTAAHSSVTTPTGKPRATIHCPWTGPPAFSGSRRRNTVLSSERGLNDAALVRQPHAGHLLRIDPRRRRAVLPALSRAAGGHRLMNLRPAGSWSSAPHDQPASLPVAVPGSRRAAPSPGQASHSSDPEDARDISRGRLWRERHARWGQVT